MTYELWNQESANLIGTFDSEGAALAFVRATAERDTTTVLEWALAVEDDNEDTHPIAAGRELVKLAFEPQHA